MMNSEKRIVQSYRYEDENGNLLYEVVRTEPKGFFARRPFYADASSFASATEDRPKGQPDGDGGLPIEAQAKMGWINNLNGVRRVPYRLPELLAADPADEVYIVEGEKDADRIIAEGFVATTNPGGAGKWPDEFNQYLKGRIVRVIQDNDDAGRRHVKDVAEKLVDVTKSLRIIDLAKDFPELPDKGDVSDFFDAGKKHGDLSILADNAPEYESEAWTKRADLVFFDEIQSRPVEFLVDNRIPLGMPTLLAGDPGMGKSYLSLYIASLVSTGGVWPDGTKVAEGKTLLLSAEDHPECVIKPRLERLGADTGRIMTFQAVRHKDADGNIALTNFDIVHDFNLIKETLDEHPDVKLVIIDPVSAYFGKADTHKDAVVRSVLMPLVKIAESHNVALVCVMHLNKSNAGKAIYKLMGSLAFPAAARTVWLVSADPANPRSRRRFLLPVKHNVLKDPTSMSFEVTPDGLLVFDDNPVTVTADEVVSPQSGIEAPERQRAVEWLKELLSDVDSMPSNEIFKLAEEEGFKETTLKRARNEIGVKCFPEFDEEGNKLWFWRLPDKEKGQSKIPGLEERLKRGREMIKKMKQNIKLPKLAG